MDAELIQQINNARGVLPESLNWVGRLIFNKFVALPFMFSTWLERIYETLFFTGLAFLVIAVAIQLYRRLRLENKFDLADLGANAKRYTWVTLFLIILLGAFLRFYKLEEFPVHLGHDEVTQLYDAISIKETGKDIYGVSYPFIFKSVNDNKPPFYTYATVISYLIFGWREITVRIPGAVFGTLLIPTVYFFVIQFFKNRKIALTSAFFTAIAPFEVIYSRKSFENQTGVLLLLLGLGTLKMYADNPKRPVLLFLGVIFAGLASYTYFSHAILIPFLLFAFFYLYRQGLGSAWKKGLITLLILIAPLDLLIYTNPLSTQRSKDVFLTQSPEVAQELKNVSSSKLKLVKTGYILGKHAYKRLINNLSPGFLFNNGLDLTFYKFIDVGPLYPYQLGLVLAGLLFLIKSKSYLTQAKLLAALTLISLLPAALTFENYAPHRIIMFFSILNIVSAVGLVFLYEAVSKGKFARGVFVGGFGLLTLYYFAFTASVYLYQNPAQKSQFLHDPFKKVAQTAWKYRDTYDQIIIDPKFGEQQPFIGTGTHYYLAFYGKYPPALMQKEYKVGEGERETTFDKFRIKALYWPEDRKLKNTLVIASPWSLSQNSFAPEQLVDIIRFYNGELAFYVVKTDE